MPHSFEGFNDLQLTMSDVTNIVTKVTLKVIDVSFVLEALIQRIEHILAQ